MTTTKHTPISILDEFDRRGRHGVDDHDRRQDLTTGAFATTADGTFTTAGNLTTAGGTEGAGEIVQVRGRKPGGGNDRGPDLTKPDDKNKPDTTTPDNGRGRNRGREFELDLGNGQQDGQSQGQEQGQGQTAGGGFNLAWANPLNLPEQLASMSQGDDGGPARPAFGVTVGHKRTARR
jgi:hypothetical protein